LIPDLIDVFGSAADFFLVGSGSDTEKLNTNLGDTDMENAALCALSLKKVHEVLLKIVESSELDWASRK